MSNMFATLKNRIPAGTIPGKRRVIARVLDAAELLQTKVHAINKRDDLTPKGRAPVLEKEVKLFGAALRRAERQLAYHTEKIERGHANLVKKAIGEAQPHDVEWRTMLRSLPRDERTKLVMSDPVARGAVLRAPGALSGVDAGQYEHLVNAAIEQNAADELAAHTIHKESNEVHEIAVRVLRNEMMKVPYLVDANGNAMAPRSPIQLDATIDKDAPQKFPRDLLLEEVEVDDTNPDAEEAA